jgi:hypothetical protein
MIEHEPGVQACVQRTRSAVLNFLVAIGLGIAVGGLVLRWRDREATWRVGDGPRHAMLAALFVLLFTSFAVRRAGTSRALLRDPSRRTARFYRAHVVSALIAALAVPLGLAYGWFVRPRLDAVGPFWIAALALGLLALPRSPLLEGFDQRLPEPNEPAP